MNSYLPTLKIIKKIIIIIINGDFFIIIIIENIFLLVYCGKGWASDNIVTIAIRLAGKELKTI